MRVIRTCPKCGHSKSGTKGAVILDHCPRCRYIQHRKPEVVDLIRTGTRAKITGSLDNSIGAAFDNLNLNLT